MTLRQLVEADASFIVQLVNSEGWLTHIGDRNIRTNDAAVSYIQSIMDQYSGNPLSLSCITRKSDSKAIGLCGILKRDFLSHPDIGYALVPEAYGQGYAYEIVSATSKKYFESSHSSTLYALIKKGNAASIRLIRKLGFNEDREVSSPHENDMIFSITNKLP